MLILLVDPPLQLLQVNIYDPLGCMEGQKKGQKGNCLAPSNRLYQFGENAGEIGGGTGAIMARGGRPGSAGGTHDDHRASHFDYLSISTASNQAARVWIINRRGNSKRGRGFHVSRMGVELARIVHRLQQHLALNATVERKAATARKARPLLRRYCEEPNTSSLPPSPCQYQH